MTQLLVSQKSRFPNVPNIVKRQRDTHSCVTMIKTVHIGIEQR